jgi:Brp/Blh family beta-carotene 15,15'-monooxygenase
VGGPLTRAPVGVQVAALATAVALFGVPHGALDPLVGRTLLAPRLGRRWWPIFHGGYLAVAGIVLAGWAAAPVGTLAGFLALSAVHFGLGDVTRGRQSPGRYAAEVLARGALPIVGPATAFPDQVATLFGWLVPVSAREGAAALAHGLAWAGPRLLAPLLAGVMLARLADAVRARGRDDHLAVAAEVGALALLVLAAPPLVASSSTSAAGTRRATPSSSPRTSSRGAPGRRSAASPGSPRARPRSR